MYNPDLADYERMHVQQLVDNVSVLAPKVLQDSGSFTFQKCEDSLPKLFKNAQAAMLLQVGIESKSNPLDFSNLIQHMTKEAGRVDSEQLSGTRQDLGDFTVFATPSGKRKLPERGGLSVRIVIQSPHQAVCWNFTICSA